MAFDSAATPSGFAGPVAGRGLDTIAVTARDALEDGAAGGGRRLARRWR